MKAPSAVRRAALSAVVVAAACGPGTGAKAGAPPADAEPPIYDVVPPARLDLYVPAWDRGDGSAVGPPTVDQVRLGKRLFFDEGMSRDASISCGTCHRPELAFTDGRRVARGVGGATGRRNSPTLVNRAWGRSHFWDGRAGSLEEQVLLPIADAAELGSSVAAELERLRTDPSYTADFRSAFGADPDSATLAAALAAFVGTIYSADAALDRYLAGDTTALSKEQRRGRRLFTGRARCSVCHMGPNLTDEAFHNTGVAWRSGAPTDSGRAEVTGRAVHVGAFKTPTLREVARTAPYMHDGSLATLEEVVELYDGGGHPNPGLDPRILPLELTDGEKAALVAFLEGLGAG